MKHASHAIMAAIEASLVIGGCASRDPKTREAVAWNFPLREIPEGDWAMPPPSHSAWVRDSEVEAAACLLEMVPFVEIDPPKTAALSRPEDGIEAAGGSLRAFLVRGVAFGEPTFATIKVSMAGTRIWVHQVSPHAEILGAYSGPPRRRPMVVLSEQPPERVFPTAYTGGDAAWRGSRSDSKWFHRR